MQAGGQAIRFDDLSIGGTGSGSGAPTADEDVKDFRFVLPALPLPPLPYSSAVVIHGTLRIATVEDVRRSVASVLAMDGGGNNADAASTTTAATSGSVHGFTMDLFRSNKAERSETESESSTQPDNAPAWVAVRAVITTDHMLHLFQPCIDIDESVLSLTRELETFGDGLVLAKSYYLKVYGWIRNFCFF